MSPCRRLGVTLALIMGAAVAGASPARAAENGLSNYLAGYYGDFAVAVAPSQGLYVYGTAYHYQAASQGPRFPETLAVDGLVGVVGFQYVTGLEIFGAKVAMGAYTTYLDASLEAAGPFGFSAHERAHGDSSVSPLVLYWSLGNLPVSLYEAVILPTGSTPCWR